MYMLLEVQDEKVAFLKEELKKFSFITSSKDIDFNYFSFFSDLNDSINYAKKIESGLVEKRDAFEFVNGL